MNKIIKLIAVVLVLTMLTLPVLGQMNSGNGNSADSGRNDSNKNNPGMMDNSNKDNRSIDSNNNDNNLMREKASEMFDNGSRMRDNEGVKGMGFMHRGDNSYGSYVTFTVDNTTGNVLNFGIAGIAVFDSINIQGFNFAVSRTEGAQTKISNADGSIVIQIHDNPAAVIEINADSNITLVFNLAAGVTATRQDNTITITAGNITAFIVSEKATSNIAGSQVTINTNGNVVFRASPINMPHDNMEGRFMGEVVTKRAGAEVSVGESDKSSVVNYSEDLNVSVDSIQSDRMRMTVESSNHSGKFILMNLDNTSLTWNAGQPITLYLDNKPLKQVMTEQDLYNATESSFWLNMTGGNKIQALIYIASFSTHTVDVVVGTPTTTPTAAQTTTPATTPKTPGFEIALGALGTVAAAYMMRRRI
ncbi:MAG: PGF-CTERM sorting domain-containing protein [Candidatus Methanoperedens sp.]|nr:PGF-CTERM sorting domain-containing protein [Candidatus Methanoperedens sp.]